MTLPATQGVLPLLLVSGPLLAAAVVPLLGRRSSRLLDAWLAVVTGVALLGAAALLRQVLALGRVAADLPLLLGRLDFAVDPFAAVFALFGAFLWFCATLYSFDYLEPGPARRRYHAASLVALGAYFGVVLAGSLLTLFVFFELLGLVAFLLVIHTGTAEARAAAIQYLWMTVLGGVALLGGILLVYATGGGSLEPVTGAAGSGPQRLAAAVLLVLGFGVKAGMLPVHTWLPNAHPAAPSPASALLSGVIIKAGAYGIFRTVFSLFRPALGTDFAEASWDFTAGLGLAVLWIGLATMAVGVVLALGQRNAKRMLAYHSISQMGFILAGLGAGAYLGGEGALGTAGGLMHAVNHALFKASLFLGVGAVALRTGQLDMYALGGLWRRMPVTFGFMLLAAAGITGVPLFNGFVSKCMIHHALEAAYAEGQTTALWLAQWLYMLVCAGTAASFLKLIGLLFIAPGRPAEIARVREAPVGMLLAMGLLSVPIVALGLWPGLLLEKVMAPGLAAWAMPVTGLERFLEHYFLSAVDVGMAVAMLMFGAVIYALGMRFGLFHLRAPEWLRLERGYEWAMHGLLTAFRGTAAAQQRLAARQGLAHAVLAALLAVAPAQQRAAGAVSRSLEDHRRRLLVHLRELGRLWRRFTATVFTGAPGTGEQQFVERAWIALDADRHAAIRKAVSATIQRLRETDRLRPREREPVTEAVRAIVGHLAGMLFNARMGAVEELTRAGDAEAIAPVLDAVLREVEASHAQLAEAAMALAHRRWAGEDIAPLLPAAIEPILERERFESRLRAAAGLRAAEHGADLASLRSRSPAGGPAAFIERGARPARALPRFGTWLVDLLRLAVAVLRQPVSTWPYSEHFDSNRTVLETRRWIERYVRDPGLNVAVMFLLFALLVALIGADLLS
jgi:formate hydrogenlyase subunit 3/multisubunit Na+/H+ antiporter MnhD subunit